MNHRLLALSLLATVACHRGAAVAVPADASLSPDATNAGSAPEVPSPDLAVAPDAAPPDATPEDLVAADATAEAGVPDATPEAASAAVPDRCLAAAAVELVSGKVVISADTTAARDEFPQLDCGGRGVAGPLAAPQLYYRFQVRPDRAYTFQLVSSRHAVLYVFPATPACSQAAIELGCRSEGRAGLTSGIINPGGNGFTSPLFAPATPGDYIVAVDSDYQLSFGRFTLTITDLPRAP